MRSGTRRFTLSFTLRFTLARALASAFGLTLFTVGTAGGQTAAAAASRQAAARQAVERQAAERRAAAPAEPNVMVNVVARDYAYDAPTTVNAGLITFHLKNAGADVHHLTVIQLPNGHSIKEFFDAMRDNGVAPAWSKTIAATPTIGKNSDAYVSVRLDAGRYILACLIPASDGRSHVAKGMYQLISVTEKLKADPTMVPDTKVAPKTSATKATPAARQPVTKP
jgi:hypothetical protein